MSVVPPASGRTSAFLAHNVERDPRSLDADAGIHDVLGNAKAIEDNRLIEQNVERARNHIDRANGSLPVEWSP
jgi:hypothetical protein